MKQLNPPILEIDLPLAPAEKPKRKLNLVEKKITKQITDWLKKQDDCWYYKVAASAGRTSTGSFTMQRTGIPDLCVIHKGRCVWLEVKRPGGYLRPNQKEEIARMESAGAEVYVVRSLDEVKAIFTGR